MRTSSASGIDGPEVPRTISPSTISSAAARACISSAAACSTRVAQFGCRKPRGFAAHHRHTRGECAHAAGNPVGLAVDDPDIRIIDTERVGTDLRNDRLNALADGGDAGDDLHRAVRLRLDAHGVERTQSALLHEHRQTGADCLAVSAPLAEIVLKFVPLRRLEGFVQQKRVVAGIVDDFCAKRIEAEANRASRLC